MLSFKQNFSLPQRLEFAQLSWRQVSILMYWLWKAPEKARSGPGVRIFPGSRMNFNVQYFVLIADEVKCIWCVTKYFLLLNIIQQINVNKLLTTGHLSLFLWKHVLILYKWPKAKVIMTIEKLYHNISVFRSICWHLAVKTKQQFT